MNEPTQARPGDTLKWSEDQGDYPSPTWAMKYNFAGPVATYVSTGTASGSSWNFVIPKGTTTSWPAGYYSWQKFAESGTERFTLGNGQLQILASLEGVTAGTEMRSHAVKALALIEAAIESYAIRPVESITLPGRGLVRAKLPELLTLRSQYRWIVQQEEAAARIANGLDGGQGFHTRFK